MIKYIIKMLDTWSDRLKELDLSEQREDGDLVRLVDYDQGKERMLPVTKDISLELIQERYRQLSIEFVNQYPSLNEYDAKELYSQIRMLKDVILDKNSSLTL